MPRNALVLSKRAQELQAISEEKREQVLQSMHEDLRARFGDFQRRIAEKSADIVKWYYDLGKDVKEIQDHPDKYLTTEQKGDGTNPIVLLETVMEKASVQTMQRCAQFAEAFTPQQRDELLRLRSKVLGRKNWRIGWSHIVKLVSIDDPVLRLKIARDAAEHAMTPKELHKAIKDNFGGPRRSGGRKLAIPKSISGQTAQVREVTRVFVERCEGTWAGKKNHVYENLMRIAPSDVTTDLKKDVQGIVDLMERAAQDAAAQAKLARKVLAHFEKNADSNGEETPPPRPARVSAIARAKKAAAR